MPWLIVAVITNTFDIMLCFYFLYYLASFIFIAFVYCRRATKFEKCAQEKMKKINEDKNNGH